MIQIFIYLIVLYVTSVTLIQGFFAILYTRLLLNAQEGSKGTYHPKAAVILAARGADPFLVENMTAVLNQDYTEYAFFIVLDSEEDSAWHDIRIIQSLAPIPVKLA